MNWLRKFRDWFTTERRQGIQMLAASLAPLLIWMGFGDESYWEQWVVIIGIGMTMIANLLNLLNLKVGDWGTGWAIVRGALYGAAIAAVPAFVTLGVFTAEQGGWILTGAGIAITVLSHCVSILTSGKQEPHAIIEVVATPIAKG